MVKKQSIAGRVVESVLLLWLLALAFPFAAGVCAGWSVNWLFTDKMGFDPKYGAWLGILTGCVAVIVCYRFGLFLNWDTDDNCLHTRFC